MKPKPPKTATVAAAGPEASRRFDLLYAAAVVLAGFAIYWRTLAGPFLFDDADLLEVTSAVRNKNLWIILTGPRPLLILSFAFNHWLTGWNPFYFHLVSILLHVLNTLILWRVARLICDSAGLAAWLAPAARRLIAVVAPLAFLAHPIQTESAGYISSRSELLAATFYLLGMLLFLSSWREKRRWTTAVLLAFLYGCAVSSKQHALTLPGAILLLDYLFLAAQDRRRLARNWPTYALLGAEMALGGVVVVGAVLNVPSAGFSLQEVTWKVYLFTQFRMYCLYAIMLILPLGLNADHHILPSRTLLDHGAGFALAGILAVLAATIYWRRRHALVCFGVLFFFLTLFPTSSFYPLLDYAAERRLYLPSIGFFLAALALAVERLRSLGALRVGLGLLLMACAVAAYVRNRVWEDGLALWQDAAQKSPAKWRAHNNLGFEYAQRGRFAEAEQAFRRAAELVPQKSRSHAEILSSLGSTYANRRLYAEAAATYQIALKINPDIPTLWTNLAIAEVRLNRPEGWDHFRHAIRMNHMAWEPYFARGNLYVELGRYEEAIRDYQRVLYLNKEHADAQNNLRAARGLQGQKKP